MIVRSLALAATASLSLALSAAAAGWDGYYLGLNAGLGTADSETARTIGGTGYFAASSITAIEAASIMSLDEQSFAGGAQFGLNWPVAEGVVLGFEADAQGFGNETTGSATVAYPCCAGTGFTTTNSVEQTWFATARVRLGFATEHMMIFATGGYAGADAKLTQTFSDTFTPIPLEVVENAEFVSGYSVGAGIEFMFEQGVSAKLEYLYLDFGEITADGTIAVATRTSSGTADVNDQVFRLGVNFQMD